MTSVHPNDLYIMLSIVLFSTGHIAGGFSAVACALTPFVVSRLLRKKPS